MLSAPPQPIHAHSPDSPAGGSQAANASAALTPEQIEQVREARALRRPIDRAANIATFDAWCTAVLAVLSLPIAFFSVTAAVICLGLAIIAAVGFIGRRLLRRADPRGPRVLGFNQLGFFAMLTVYCLWSIYKAVAYPVDLSPYLGHDPQLDAMLADMDIQTLYRQLAIIVYSGVILGSAVFQGGLAVLYFSRDRHVRRYLEMPDWTRQVS